MNKFTSDSQRYLAGCPATPSIDWGAPGEELARGIRLGQVDGGWCLRETEDLAVTTTMLRPILVPIAESATHPLLRHAAISGDTIVWPWRCARSLSEIKVITVDEAKFVSMPPRVNVDFVVDHDADEEGPPLFTGRANDLQRFYDRCDDMFVGHFELLTAITLKGVRRYFAWREVLWCEIGLPGFLQFRDGPILGLLEVEKDQAETLAPGSTTTAARPRPPVVLSERAAHSQHGRAAAIATLALRGCTDGLGYPQIDQAARVASTFSTTAHPMQKCTSWLAGVLDTDVTARDLLDAGVLPVIVEAVLLLSRGLSYDDSNYFILIRRNKVAREVMLAKLKDEGAFWRTRQMGADAREALRRRYLDAHEALDEACLD